MLMYYVFYMCPVNDIVDAKIRIVKSNRSVCDNNFFSTDFCLIENRVLYK